jgi:hypothetical protein
VDTYAPEYALVVTCDLNLKKSKIIFEDGIVKVNCTPRCMENILFWKAAFRRGFKIEQGVSRPSIEERYDIDYMLYYNSHS